MKVRELIKILADCPFQDNYVTIKVPWYPNDRFHISEMEYFDNDNSANSFLLVRSIGHVLTNDQVEKAQGNVS